LERERQRLGLPDRQHFGDDSFTRIGPSEADRMLHGFFRLHGKELHRFDQRCNTVTFQGRALQNYEGLTVAVGFQKGVVAEPPPPTFFELHAVALVGGGITLLLLLYYFVTWKRFGRDPDIPTVIPLFEPPDGLSPASVGMVMEGAF
jgi:hypothetical protein